MATELTVQSVGIDLKLEDVTLTAGDTDGMSFDNNGKTYLLIKNDSAGSLDVIITCQGCSHNLVQHKTVSTGASDISLVGPFDKSVWNDSDQEVNMTIADATSLTLAAINIA